MLKETLSSIIITVVGGILLIYHKKIYYTLKQIYQGKLTLSILMITFLSGIFIGSHITHNSSNKSVRYNIENIDSELKKLRVQNNKLEHDLELYEQKFIYENPNYFLPDCTLVMTISEFSKLHDFDITKRDDREIAYSRLNLIRSSSKLTEAIQDCRKDN